MADEIEMKFSIPQTIDRQTVIAACQALGEACTKPEAIQMAACYFDTADQALQKAQLAYRTRAENGAWRATIKGRGEVKDGLARRLEIERSVSGGQADLNVFWGTPAQDLVQPFLKRELAAIVETEFERIRFRGSYEGAQLEFAVDCGEIRAAQQTAPIREAEIELLSGEETALVRVAARLCQRLPLTPENRSKFARGLALRNKKKDNAK